MAKYIYENIKKDYEGFYNPIVYVYVSEKDIVHDKNSNYSISELSVDLSCEYKANIATFTISGALDEENKYFDVDAAKNYIMIGSSVRILMGYGIKVTEVFRGYIARVAFTYESNPSVTSGINITAMDVKGIMMSNNYSKRMTSSYYSDAVSEIFNQTVYQNLVNSGIVSQYLVSATPDKPGAAAGGSAGDLGGLSDAGGLGGATDMTGGLGGAADMTGGLGGLAGGAGGFGAGGVESDTPAKRIEMTSESDYDFIVKAAKKFGYEFFSLGSYVYFRKAKENAEVLLQIDQTCNIFSYNIEYDITGLVGSVEVRGVDVDKGSVVKSKVKNTNKLSLGSKAKSLISSQTKVYIDSSTDTKEAADIRANSIMEDMSYRLGSLEMLIIGIPELLPGSYVEISGIGSAISNKFYITEVEHFFDLDGNFKTKLYGKAASLPQDGASGIGLGGDLGLDSDLMSGLDSVTSGLDELSSGLDELSEGADELSSGYDALNSGMDILSGGLNF
ncbi:MAG: hypothetical protein K6B41_11160 [Butyrivibrio sp.]|nr:hypothetical protein [Butyrivibrio sp.]